MARKRKRRNRKKRVDGFIFPAPFAGILVFVSVAALSYLWLCSRCEALGREIKTLEQQQEKLANKFLNEEYKWMRLKSPQSIEAALTQYGISMTWPRRDQVVWLDDTHLGDELLTQPLRETEQRYARVRRIPRHE